MELVLVIHLIIAICLIAVVLLQRSEGGALGMGGGGGGMVSQRGAATALSKLTWALATGFICTSILLTIMAGGGSGTGSVTDQPAPELSAPLPSGDGSAPLPGSSGSGAPLPSGQSPLQTPLPSGN